jgi:hypothetical protein
VEPTSPVTTEVEFEHRRLKPGTVPVSLQKTQDRFSAMHTKLMQRARWSRVVFVLLGALAIAWGTQRAGIELPAALCFFFGALPVLWVGGWLFGFLFQARRAAKYVATTVGSTQWQGELAAATVVEKVKLSMSTLGLHVTRGDEAKVFGWGRVRMQRIGPGALAVFVGEETTGLALNEAMNVPSTAFSSDTAFDDFCLAMQRFIWEAQRKS